MASDDASLWPLADSWRRLMGLTYEAVILFAVLFFFGYAYSAVTQLKNSSGWNSTGFQVWIFLVLAAYFSYFWSQRRQSLPMKTLNLLRAFLRYCAVIFLLAAPLAMAKFWHPGFAVLSLATFIWTLFDRQSRALHDLIAGTLLVVTPQSLAKLGKSQVIAK
jgi:uncharacterized RDD family membrane protein YckC